MKTKITAYKGKWIGLAIALILIGGVWFLYSYHIAAPKDTPEEVKLHHKAYPNKFAEYFNDISKPINGNADGYPVNHTFIQYHTAKDRIHRNGKKKSLLNWKERGPGNLSGRTRALIVDPDDPDHNTWFAGAVSGGVWKTTNGGQSWVELTKDMPLLAVSCMAMSNKNHDIIYAGTGEGFFNADAIIGNGVFKSYDRAISWEQLGSTVKNEDFEYVNRIIVDYESDDTVLVCTSKGIFKSANGGTDWYKVYEREGHSVMDLVADPNDFSIMYAGVYGFGIVKSTDKGETWRAVNEGIDQGGRFEIDVSPVNTNRVFASVSGTSNNTIIYISIDAGESWRQLKEKNGNSYNYLRTQGFYDNIITCHPYDENIVFVGGVTLGQIEFSRATEEGEPQVLKVDTVGTGQFLRFVRFGGSSFWGALVTGKEEEAVDLDESDWTSVEILFGPGRAQKAHRYVVPEGGGAGIPPDEYEFADYVDVPFEVWNTRDSVQLMVGFRDNERDGKFTIFESDYDIDSVSREYIFVNAIDYDPDNPSVDLMDEDDSYTYKLLYFLWPAIMKDSTWNAERIPESKIIIEYGKPLFQLGEAKTISDAYNNDNEELHVDHHELIMIRKDDKNKRFWILNGNDGGLGISYDGGRTWSQITNGYNTTQFYGVAKKPGEPEFIGGMQDNGTWQSTPGILANMKTQYLERLGGDGFDALWHPKYPHRIIGSLYNNIIYVTNNGGEDWSAAFSGINGDGPFFTKISHSRQKPDLLFAVGRKGVYRHFNFGMGRYPWELTTMPRRWDNDNYGLYHVVKVSLANPSVVWAGGGISNNPDYRLFVSTNQGNSFRETAFYDEAELGFISGLNTHPTNPGTAYALFSVKESPKILRTMDLGQSWEDISGFGAKDSSDNGFPDVRVFCLLVHPQDTNTLWAGTEIGIIESLDNGETWAYADNGLPSVAIWDMIYQDEMIVVATHGRGVWTLNFNPTGTEKTSQNKLEILAYPNPVRDILTVRLPGTLENKQVGIQIYDQLGKTVYTDNVLKANRNQICNLDFLPRGIYFVEINHNGSKGTVTIQKD